MGFGIHPRFEYLLRRVEHIETVCYILSAFLINYTYITESGAESCSVRTGVRVVRRYLICPDPAYIVDSCGIPQLLNAGLFSCLVHKLEQLEINTVVSGESASADIYERCL